MDFSRRKLPKEAALHLRICPIVSVQPYALMLAPVYVFMRQNEKFVSIKGPLDFFTPEELDRFKSFESFYLPEFVDLALPFRQAARNVRSIVGWQPTLDGLAQLPPAPYEISDAALRMIGPLWGAGAEIEPFFAAVFANELCDLLPEEHLLEARERNVEEFERAVLRSSWAVFLALHLGYCDLGFLNMIRAQMFALSLRGEKVPAIGRAGEVQELVEIVWTSLSEDAVRMVKGSVFTTQLSRAAQKMKTRLERVKSEMIREDQPAATIFGARGFVGA